MYGNSAKISRHIYMYICAQRATRWCLLRIKEMHCMGKQIFFRHQILAKFANISADFISLIT